MNRLTMIWMSVMTVYMACTTTDTYSVLRSVQGNQESTLKYMQKSADILRRLKHLKMVEPKGKYTDKLAQKV